MQRGVAVFSHVAPYNFPCFQKGDILVFHLKYFIFLFVNIAKSYVSRLISVVCFKQSSSKWSGSISPYFARLSSSTGFPVVFIFWAFEAPQGHWNILLNPLKTIAHLYLFGSMGLIKCQDVIVGLNSFFAFANGDSYICNSLFPQGWCYLIFCSQCQLPTPDNSLGSVEFLMWVGSVFRWMKSFHFLYAFCLPLAVHLDWQVSVLGFLNSFLSSSCRNNFFFEERREFGLADLLQRFNNNDSGEVCCLILQVSFIFFYLKTPYMLYIFRWPCDPPPTTEYNLCWEWIKE